MRFFQTKNLVGRRIQWLLVGSLWLGSVTVGLALITRNDFTAGVTGPALLHWPTQSGIPFSDHDYTLVMFAHPHCPCTRASLEELAKLLTRYPNSVSPWVVFFKPSDTDGSWTQTDQWQTASTIPGVHVLTDVDGAEAKLFHAQTSGHTLLFGPSGELLFSGGITMARGHAGDNDGRSAIEAILANATPDVRETSVYGCPIIPPTSVK